MTWNPAVRARAAACLNAPAISRMPSRSSASGAGEPASKGIALGATGCQPPSAALRFTRTSVGSPCRIELDTASLTRLIRCDDCAAGNAAATDALRAVERLPKVSGGGAAEAYISPRTKAVLDAAFSEAGTMKDEYVSIEHILLALVADKGEAGRILSRQGITRDAVFKVLQEIIDIVLDIYRCIR